MTAKRFGFAQFAIRFVAALVLVVATYNPEGYSFFHWVKGDIENGPLVDALADPYKALALVILIAGWSVFLLASIKSLGLLGLILPAAFFAVLVWLAFDMGMLDINNSRVMAYVVMFIITGVLAIGVSWSHIQRRITGQIDIDDIGD